MNTYLRLEKEIRKRKSDKGFTINVSDKKLNVVRRLLTSDNLVHIDTRLADRLAAHQSMSTKNQIPAKNEKSIVECNKIQLDAKGQQSPSFVNNDALQKALQDLGEAQRSRGATELRLLQLADQTKKLFSQSRSNCKHIAELTSEKTQLAARMRDRDEELKAKSKLLEVRT